MVAFSASRLVWPAILEIRLTMLPMRSAASLSAWTRRPVSSACRTALRASPAESSTWRPTACTEVPRASAAPATRATWEAAASAALATAPDRSAVSPAVRLIWVAVS
ncbi:hypothetical protein AEGHOMDF_6101 [Methylobacterium soli]|nr:hypothetical protein AEGHOMDF_6101 [Methylobacterium soli]